MVSWTVVRFLLSLICLKSTGYGWRELRRASPKSLWLTECPRNSARSTFLSLLPVCQVAGAWSVRGVLLAIDDLLGFFGRLERMVRGASSEFCSELATLSVFLPNRL